MRLSSFQIHNQASRQLQSLGTQTAQTQQQIASGKKLRVPGDDPIGAARVIAVNQELQTREQYARNADAADVQLALEESVIGQVEELVQRVRELAIQAGSGIQTADDREFLATEIDARFEELLALANTRNAAGQYLFSGYQGNTSPFERVDNEVIYHGDGGERRLQIDREQYVQINDSGADVFMDVPVSSVSAKVTTALSQDASVSDVRVVDAELANAFYPERLVIEFSSPSSYSVIRASDKRPVEGLQNVAYSPQASVSAAGISFKVSGSPQAGDTFVIGTAKQQSVFATVQGIATGLREIDASAAPDDYQNMIDSTLEGLDSATTTLLRARTDIGARFGTITAVKDLHEDLNLQLQTVKSEIEDLDFASAISELAYQSFVLEAAQQSFVRINNLSLFNRL